MFNKKNFAIVGSVFLAFTWLSTSIAVRASETAIHELYPGLPKKTVRTAHRRFLKDVLTNKVELDDSLGDESIQRQFETYYLDPINAR